MGLAYQIRVILMRQNVDFVLLNWNDWLPWAVLPALGNASLIAGGVGLIAGKGFSPFAVAGSSALLLFAGIYGAWDLTLWMIKNRDKTSPRNDSGSHVANRRLNQKTTCLVRFTGGRPTSP